LERFGQVDGLDVGLVGELGDAPRHLLGGELELADGGRE
jgi:hypothetical protein